MTANASWIRHGRSGAQASTPLLLISMIMACQFGTLWEPLVIMLTVPLGMIGGLTVSTGLTLLVIPLFYLWMSQWIGRRADSAGGTGFQAEKSTGPY